MSGRPPAAKGCLTCFEFAITSDAKRLAGDSKATVGSAEVVSRKNIAGDRPESDG